MKMLNLDEMEKVQGGDATSECTAALLTGLVVGGAVGSGLGAVIGVAITGTSSSCLGWW